MNVKNWKKYNEDKFIPFNADDFKMKARGVIAAGNKFISLVEEWKVNSSDYYEELKELMKNDDELNGIVYILDELSQKISKLI